MTMIISENHFGLSITEQKILSLSDKTIDNRFRLNEE